MKYILSLALTAFLVSCGSSPTNLVSKPPVKALKVESFSHGDGFLIKKFTFPKDIYTPTLEDKDSYYYSPPDGRVKIFDSGMNYGGTGGVYMNKNSTAPTGIYIKAPFSGKYAKLKKTGIPATPVLR